ncbi:hypothetical protein HF521_016691 [Silurus meridionalis]|uniref:Uncharacterized protein n=1 Tax=Silurus meridionalis TaxID=175797 RepID=A0A8T0BR68_SILME|nr:hypothetical protein HF521_016691 [Silurus meridionalis]
MWAWLNSVDVKRNPERSSHMQQLHTWTVLQKKTHTYTIQREKAYRCGNCSEADSPAEPEGEEMQRRDNIKKRVMIEIKLQDEGQQAEGHKEPSEMDEQYH